jgi:hypothetical protein
MDEDDTSRPKTRDFCVQRTLQVFDCYLNKALRWSVLSTQYNGEYFSQNREISRT